jgi:flagellar motor switch/type III secretory pathway protein FliN
MNDPATSSISKGEPGVDTSVQLELIQNVAVNVSVEVGRSSLRIRDLLRLG